MKLHHIRKVVADRLGHLIESPPQIVRKTFFGGHFCMESLSGKKTVYLTFDDGPIPESTPWLLDVLGRYDIKATFFMVGDNVRKYPQLYELVIARGHKAGNHTMHHLNGLLVPTSRYVADVFEAEKYIDSRLLRPPHGWMRVPQRLALKRDFQIMMYDVVTRDYSKFVTAERVVENVMRHTRPGSIIVFHDSLKSIDKLKSALPESIEWLKNNGYSFATIE